METNNKRDYDEKFMITEQERLAQEKKKRRRRKGGLAAAGVLFFLAACGAVVLVWGKNIFTRQEETSVQIETAPGQEVVYARLDSVMGNEITYTTAQEEGEVKEFAPRNQEQGEEISGRRQAGIRKEGEMERPPEGGGADIEFNRGDGSRPDMQGLDNSTFTYNNIIYRLTGETVTAQIPVGTQVTTKLGTVTTFSRLAAGDFVALVMDTVDGEKTISAVYIVG